MNFNALKDCPVCSGTRKDCRKSEMTGRVHCRSGITPDGYDSFGTDGQGFNMYKIAKDSDDSEGSTPLSLSDRDHQYRGYRSFLTKAHKLALTDRGLTEAQIDWLHSQGWIRSWARGQSSKLDPKLAGVDPKNGQTLGCDGIAIAAIFDNKITGYQIANDDRRTAKYLWLSSAKVGGSTPHLPNGDLPLAAWIHPEVKPTEVILCEGFLKSLVTAIRLWAEGKTEYMVIGAAGGNFGASAQTTRDLLNKYQISSVLLAPDGGVIHHKEDESGGWLPNETVMAAYDRAKSVCAGRDFNVLWWGQKEKDSKDIDELADRDLVNLGIISWDEFKAMVPKTVDLASPAIERKRNMMDLLQDIVDRCELWQTEDGETWVDVPRISFKEPILLDSDRFRRWLAKSFLERHGYRCKPEAINQVLMACAGFADEANVYAIHHRCASNDGKIYIDLGTRDRQIVEISGAGWRIITEDCPVKFKRPSSMKPLPIPSAQPDWSGLRQILNLEESDWVLLLTWLSWGLHPDRPHPILILNGEQGTGKSKLSELLKRLIDPAKALLLSMPRDERNLKAHASNRWCLVYDNLSGLSSEMSDALCRLATGGGLVDRALYTDTNESVFDGVRPMVLNGIGAMATRPDLLERSIILNLSVIPDDQRITEEAWENILTGCQSAIFGSLLDAVAQGLRTKPTINLLSMGRMADFDLWGHAVETSFGFAAGTFEAAYVANRGLVHQAAIDNDAVATHLLMLMENASNFTGTASQLLSALNSVASEEQRRAPDWIKSPRVLGRLLVRLAPELRKCGVEARTGIRSMGQRLIVLDFHELPQPETPPDLPSIEEEISFEYVEPEEPDIPIAPGEVVVFQRTADTVEFTIVAIEGESCTITDLAGGIYRSRLDWLRRIEPMAAAG
jgi:hypothetical protein